MKWKTWELLRRLKGSGDEVWLCPGDFNEIMFDYEKMGGTVKREKRMREFRECMEDCGPSDLGFSGVNYTWTKK